MKEIICASVGGLGAGLIILLGGWDIPIQSLLIFMGVDFFSGLAVAGVFKKSGKSRTGALESRAGWKGLCKKAMTLLFVAIGHSFDRLTGMSYVRNAVVMGFLANELLSIAENAGLMGLPLPAAVTKAIEVLKEKSGDNAEKDSGSPAESEE